MLKIQKRSSSKSIQEKLKKAQSGFKKHFKTLKEKINEMKWFDDQ